MSQSINMDKWISGLDAKMPAVEAASQVLRMRLEAVDGLVDRLKADQDDEAERVHQLRVSTRRAGAALRVFRAFIKPSHRKRVRQRLKRFRQAAGDVRECQVHLKLLRNHLAGEPGSLQIAIEHAIGRAWTEEKDAEAALEAVARRRGGKPWRKWIKRTLASVAEPYSPFNECSDEGRESLSVQAIAKQSLVGLIAQFRAAAQDDLATQAKLHALRLCGKRLRYAIEIFGCCLEPSLREEFSADLAALQDRLGDINDLHQVARQLDRYAIELREALDGRIKEQSGWQDQGLVGALGELAKHYWQRCAQRHQHFVAWCAGEDGQLFLEKIDHLFPAQSDEPFAGDASDAPDKADEAVVVVIQPAAQSILSSQIQQQ